jgi:hypothetical protein
VGDTTEKLEGTIITLKEIPMTTQRKFETGPFLTAAFFCEKLLVESDNVKSAIRIVDRLIIQIEGPQAPQEMPPFPYNTTLFMQFKSGTARGPMQLEIQMIKPSGESKSIIARAIMFEGEEDRGADVVCNLSVQFRQSGIYWFYIYLDGYIITRVPFRVIYLSQIKQIPFPGTDIQ